jgi:phage terminase large subunit GpA-like protein
MVDALPYPKLHAALWQRYADALRPQPDLSPSEFAAAHRILHTIYCSERPGKWSGEVFPFQNPLMDMVEEAIRSGKRGVVYMKSGQGGGTDLAINGMLWLKVYYPGPQLFLTSTDDVAGEFGRERFRNIIPDMKPLRERMLVKREEILTHRFVDGKIQLAGGQSVFKLQSTPYRVVVIDEVDSLVENLGGEGDPIKLAEVRTDSFTGQTLIIAYAHPTSKERGAGKLYFEDSDQRRGFVVHGCGGEFWFQWDHVRCTGDPKDPDAYVYACPHCGEVISDSERVAMMRKVKYRSILPPEEARKKSWIGGHFSQLMYPAKTLRGLVERFIGCGDDENHLRVFWNKVLGEPYEPKVRKISTTSLRSLVVVKRRSNDPEFYSRGQVPPGVKFLTAGQDSRGSEFHFSVWGWGYRRAMDRTLHLCGWLIDWGTIKRAYSLVFSEAEYHVFDDLIYRRRYLATDAAAQPLQVTNCAHDMGYAPTQIPILRYCRHHQGRAIPMKGASLTATSASAAPYARWSLEMTFRAGEAETKDLTSKALIVNTYMLKTEWYGWADAGKNIEIPDRNGAETVGVRKVSALSFPEDVDDDFIDQSASEYLAKGKRRDELVWMHRGPNHYADCNTMAHGLARNNDKFLSLETVEEREVKRTMPRPVPRQNSGPVHDPAMG